MDTILQLVLNGLAVGCIYGLVALGFVLIYKATELVNFAQGDLLMLGAFVAYMAVVWWGLDYWLAFLISVVTIGVFGALLDATVLRNVIGQPQFAVVMLTIGLGAMFRTFASVTWGSELYTLPTPFGGTTVIWGVTLSDQYLSIIVGTFVLCGTLYAFFNYTRIGPQIGVDLVAAPEMANDPTTAGLILAQFLKNVETKVRAALADGNLRLARKLVNGGSHGLDRFEDAFERGQRALTG